MFCKGDRVMYPQHGAAVIEELEERVMFGERKTYFRLRFMHRQLTVMVPVDTAEQVGLRDVISGDEIEKVFDLLREDEGWMPAIWSQRYKTNLAKLVSGDVYQCAELVRDLTLRQTEKRLSAAEKRMLDKAREILISELTFAIDSTDEQAETMLDDVLAEPSRTPRKVRSPAAVTAGRGWGD